MIRLSDLCEQLELAFEHESVLRDTLNWGRKWLADFIARKTQLVLFDRSYNSGAIDVKMNGTVLKEKSSFEMLGLLFSSTNKKCVLVLELNSIQRSKESVL